MANMTSTTQKTLAAALTASVGLGLILSLTGCDDSSQQAANTPPPRPTAPPPPPPPAEVNFDALMQTMNADPRVQIAPSVSTENATVARAAVTLASAIAAGDAEAARAVISAENQPVIDALTESGDWAGATAGIEAVRITELSSSGVTLAVQDAQGAYPLVWTVADSGDGVTRFTGQPAPQVELNRASEFDDGIPEPTDTVAASFRPSMRYPTAQEIQQAYLNDDTLAAHAQRYQQAHNQWMASIGDEAFYLNHALGADWAANTAGADLNSDEGRAAVAQQYGMTTDAVASKIDGGRASWESGGRCTPAEMLATIESFTLLPGFEQPERAVVAAISEITGLSSSEIRAMADQARQEGQSPFAEILPADTEPEPEAEEEEDDGYTEKSSPAGPIRVPTGRPKD